jgi:hypothetical protein
MKAPRIPFRSTLAACVLAAAGCGSMERSQDPGDLMARDAINFFGQLCLSTEGDRRAIEERLSRSTSRVVRVPGSELPQTSGDRHRAAWDEISPNGARLRLLVDDVQFCSVDVAAADGATVHTGMQAMLDRLYGDRGFQYRTASDEFDRETGVRRQRFLVRLPSRQGALIEVATRPGRRAAEGRISFAFTGIDF